MPRGGHAHTLDRGHLDDHGSAELTLIAIAQSDVDCLTALWTGLTIG